MPNDDIIDDTKLEWSTNSEGVHHSGITNKEPPFRNQLCSGTVDPSGLKNVTGKLEVSSGYKKNTSATINAGGTSRNVKEPYVMTSFASFDVEHAKNVKVDNDKAMDQDGSFIATGLAMIGLAQSLEADNMVDLSESVTITADVTGFVMPDITTMASNQVLYMVGVDATDDLDSNPRRHARSSFFHPGSNRTA